MSESFIQALRQAVRGEVSDGPVMRGVYATDASHYQVMPSAVVVPLDRADLIAAVGVAAAHGVPVTMRGGGTSLSGQTTWSGVVIDVSKHLGRVLEVDEQAGWARVEPGVVRDRLNATLKPKGLHFAPDPATGNRATVGGMIANNSAGMRSVVYGQTSDHVLSLTCLLADGTVVTLEHRSAEQWAALAAADSVEGRLYAGVERVIAANRDEIAARFPKIMRRVSGYALDALLDETDRSLASLVIGSEGTLAVVLEAKIKLTPLPAATALCVLQFEEVLASLRVVPTVLEHGPSAVELLDEVVNAEAARNPATRDKAGFLKPRPSDGGPPGGVLICEFMGDSPQAAIAQAEALAQAMREQGVGYAWTVVGEPEAQQAVWEVRKLGLGLISNTPGPVKGQAFIEDAAVPVEHLADYIGEVFAICEAEDVPISIYAHASVGVIHCRPMLDLHAPEHVEKMKRISVRCLERVMHYGGAWSGEHGDGLVRGGDIPAFFGTRLSDAFAEIKRLFDPEGLMNPGKIVGVPSKDEHLRYDPKRYALSQVPATRFGYRDQGSFAEAVEQCNGVGACRKIGSGTMCPSYMATKDEVHSTRGRANALRLAMTGQLGEAKTALASDELYEALSLCLSCKACRSECPNQVDMAKLKAEALQWRHEQRGTPMSARLIAGLPRMRGWMARWVNPWRKLGVMKRMAGVDARRTLPAFAMVRRSKLPGVSVDTDVVVFVDTWSRLYEPGLLAKAVAVLEAAGLRPGVWEGGCCQRPAISQGLLTQARRGGAKLMQGLTSLAKAVPVVVLEPSCASAILEDLPDLLGEGQDMAARVKLLEEVLVERGLEQLPGLGREVEAVLLHAHCHQQAGPGNAATVAVLEHAGVRVHTLDAGCCGMAGAFGYAHHDVSMAVGEDRLFPAVRARGEAAVCATGVSCRHQIMDGTGAAARHWLDWVRVEA